MDLIYFKLIKTTKLKKKDLLSKNDVYIKIKYGEKEKKSAVKKNASDSIYWKNEIFAFEEVKDIKKIEFELWDKDGICDDLLYKHTFDLNSGEIKQYCDENIFAYYGKGRLFDESVKKEIKETLKKCETYFR